MNEAESSQLSTCFKNFPLSARPLIYCFDPVCGALAILMMEGNWKEIHSNTLHTQDDDDAAEE